ncbi:hypothetical protein MANES_06G172000v8 [Manihot esculenta]|uniref:Uncharacterized protein n=1 Tax=Manihot esculenta TaxID=3983 RepID=A0ACB7HMW9_MANES|nr:hypothetical protein MANES_06G172000v8 [Manihot esculenta]
MDMWTQVIKVGVTDLFIAGAGSHLSGEFQLTVRFKTGISPEQKVVFRRNYQKPATADVDGDAERLSFAVAMAKVSSEVKAADIGILFVKPLAYWTRFFLSLQQHFSRPRIDAIASKIRDLAEKTYGKVPSGTQNLAHGRCWILAGDVVIHIFLPRQRAFYNLEEFYGNASPIELPLENQPPFRSENGHKKPVFMAG